MTLNVPNGSRVTRYPSRRPMVRGMPTVGPVKRSTIGFPANTNRPPSRTGPQSLNYQRATRNAPLRMRRGLLPLLSALLGAMNALEAHDAAVSGGTKIKNGFREKPGSPGQYQGDYYDVTQAAGSSWLFPSGVNITRNGNPWQPLWRDLKTVPAGKQVEYYVPTVTVLQLPTFAVVTATPEWKALPGEAPVDSSVQVWPEGVPQLRPRARPRPRPNRGLEFQNDPGFTIDYTPGQMPRVRTRVVRTRPPRGVRERKVSSRFAAIMMMIIEATEIVDLLEVFFDAADLHGNFQDNLYDLFVEGAFLEMDLETLAWGLIYNTIEDRVIGHTLGYASQIGGPRGSLSVAGVTHAGANF